MRPTKTNTRAKETRVTSSTFEIRASKGSDKNTAFGSAIVYNSRSEFLGFYEVILPGAASESLRTNDQFCYYNHDSARVLGRKSSGTLDIQDSKTALNFTVDLPNTPDGITVRELISRQDVRSCSFGFTVPDGGDTWSELPDGNLLRTISTLTLYEVSIVPEPAYTATQVSLRSLPKHLRAKLKAKTKSVDSVELPADCFAYVGDPKDPETWKLPIRFPGDEGKTVSHIKDALARFDQTEGIPDSDKAKVYDRIVKAAKVHGITVAKETYGSGRSKKTTGAMSEQDADAFLKWASDDDGSSDSDSPVNADDDGADSDDTDDLDGDSEDECRCLCANCQAGECRRCNTAECEDNACRAALCPIQQRSFHRHLLKYYSR